MTSLSIKILIICLVIFPLTLTQNPCPVQNNNGTIFTGQIIISENGGFAPLIQGQDTQCYNYSLQYTFYRVPDVAIAVYDFQADVSQNLHYFIKPLETKSLSFIPFIIQTQWPYTRWIRISYSFLAQDKPDFEAGYYLIDSGVLASCVNGKVTNILLPFRTSFNYHQKIKHHTFLHGYQINTQKITQQSRSPFQVQLTTHDVNSSGITLTISVTTITQVNFLYVSYIAYQITTLQIIAGSYVFEGESELIHTPSVLIGRNYARIHGITGFLLNYNHQKIYFRTQWTGTEFFFILGKSQKLLQYLGYQYIFFTGSNCKYCPGYTISYNNTCVRYCPKNTYLTPQGICLSCGQGKIWNGTTCVKTCPKGQYLNITTLDCQCPNSLNWNGNVCIACTQGKSFNDTSKTCQCPYPLRWNGFICTRIAQCTGGKQWDVYSYSCKCPSHLMETHGRCISIPRCLNGQILVGVKCVCPSKTYWNGKSCAYTNCIGSQTWNGEKCICRSGSFFNGRTCIQCINGQVWNENQRNCQCQDGYKWNGKFCKKQQTCSGGRMWNSTYEQCICPHGYIWTGYNCKPKPTCCCGQRFNTKTQDCQCFGKAKWNGTTCVTCNYGKIWDIPSQKCVCPAGTRWDSKFCSVIIDCGGGMMWNQNTWACECPSSTVWNGHFCISNPCSKGRRWNENFRSCQCPDDKVWQNEVCIPPKMLCVNGKIWDQTIYSCICPQGTYNSINSCDPIPFCEGQKIYNPYNNKCQCGFGLRSSGNICINPSCPQDLGWNGYRCMVINCPPLTIFRNGKCQISDAPQDNCLNWEYWNGKNCKYFPESCPQGTNWNGTHCSSTGSCSQGYFKGQSHICQPFPQLCLPQTTWNGHTCQINHKSCPQNTFLQGTVCMPYVPCQNGKIWSTSYLFCVCPNGTQDNGNVCLTCPNQKIWVPGEGCQCPVGKYDIGSNCQYADQYKCKNIPNSQWKDGLCICKPGYIVEGIQCVCKGFDKGSYCQKCTHKPHSELKNGLCQCIDGYSDVLGNCVPKQDSSGNDNPAECNVATYFDVNQRKCLPCPQGCLSCQNCYTCKICRPQFNYYAPAERCIEHCGDGKKFSVECDDGNNNDGDGCSLDCKIQSGYICTGGTPDSKDNCRIFKPSQVSISQSGQIRLPQSIILNIKINFVPKQLLQSFDCNNECQNVLIGEIISGDRSSTSMKSKYISGTTFFFSFEIQFGRTYIGKFTIRIKINPAIAIKYYGGISLGQAIKIDVNPAYLAKQNKDQLL